MMLNKSVLVGRLTKDPAYFKKGEVIISTFCLAVERGYKSKEGNMVVDFIVCKAFGKIAHNIHQYTKKGQLIALTGQIQSRTYTKDDKKQYVTEIVCETIKFLSTPSSYKNAIPQSKEDMNEFISENIEKYSEDTSNHININHSKEDNNCKLSKEYYDQYKDVVEVIDANKQEVKKTNLNQTVST